MPVYTFKDRWEKIETIGEGGQGEVFRVLEKSKFRLNVISLSRSIELTRRLNRQTPENEEQVRRQIAKVVQGENPMNCGALKILHSPDEARNFEDAEERLKRELEAMKQAGHPNLLKIVDHNTDEKWFVSKYYPNGTLKDRSGWFTGQVERTLTAIRPIVDGVAALHGKKFVHRDIKPENIFVDESEQLVLGDFGLVFFEDSEHTRLSGTLENVGSPAWMPLWATHMRIEDIRPSFDVFSLGKTIWSMVSSKPILRLWYHREDEFNLERMFPNRPEMVFLNALLDKCIVEHEKDCLSDASWLLAKIDDLRRALRLGADPVGDFVRPCRVCGFGEYELLVDRDHRTTGNFGLEPAGGAAFKIFTCNYCGHVQFFFCQSGSNPPAWEENCLL